jgi:hypothetical protein
MTMINDRERLAGAADYYETHDISQEMEAGTWERHEGKQPLNRRVLGSSLWPDTGGAPAGPDLR